jgi:hypothetical protein
MIGFEHYSPTPAISVSTLDCFARCPRRYFYKYGVEIGPEEHVALKFGEAIHAAIPSAHFGDLAESMKRFDLVWENRIGDDKRNRSNAALMLANYMEAHSANRSLFTLVPPPAGIVQVTDKISDYEVPFVLDIGLPLPLVGRIDGLGKHRDTGEDWVVEYKTSSIMTSNFLEGFTISPQVLAYVLAARSYGVPVKGAIVEALKVSSAKKDAHMTMCQPIPVTDHLLDEFLSWAKRVGQQIIDCEKARDFPMDVSACTSYAQFGTPGYQCEYTPACLADDWTRMSSLYQKTNYPTFENVRKLLGVARPVTTLTIGGTRNA